MLFRKASSTDRDFVRLAKTDPEIRMALTPIVRQAAGWDRLPKGWTQDSVKKFWESLTGEAKHKVTKCIEKMKTHMDEPGGFCASIADMIDPGWRSRGKKASFKAWDSKFMDPKTAKLLGDSRYIYKPFHELSPADQSVARRAYNKSPGAKYDFMAEHYHYPIGAKGQLARARRVLAIPYKLIQDDSYMAGLGYRVNMNWIHAPSRTAALTDLSFLATVLEPLRPEVKDYNRFVRNVYNWFGVVTSDPFPEMKVQEMDVVSYGLETTWTGPESTIEYEFPEVVNIRLADTGNLLSFSKMVTRQFRIDIINAQKFLQSFVAFLASRNGLVFIKVLSARILMRAKRTDWWDNIVGDNPFADWFEGKASKSWSCSTPTVLKIDNLKILPRIVGSTYSITVSAKLTLKPDNCVPIMEDMPDAGDVLED